MPWTCRLVEYCAGEMKPGDMWYGDESRIEHMHLSEHYHRDWKGKRPPLYVMTPAGSWCVDRKPIENGEYKEGGWIVTGEAPNITASPSINFPGSYHGWLQNGVLSDDVEGRQF